MTYMTRILSAITLAIICATSVLAQSSPKVTGFMKLTGNGSEGEPTAMKITNVRARVSGDVDEKTSYTFFVDMVRNDVLLDAAISHKVLPTVTVTAGQFKSPYSTDNLVSGTGYPFISRGYLKSKITPSFRDIGVKITHKKDAYEITAALMNGSGANKAETNINKCSMCRAMITLAPWMSVSGNYSHSVSATDGIDINLYDAGVHGVFEAINYAGEYACKCHDATTSHVGAIWVSCDCPTGYAGVPVVTPAFKCEMYDPDIESGNDRIVCYTAGISAHMTAINKNRLRINYEYRNYEAADSDSRGGIEYMVKF